MKKAKFMKDMLEKKNKKIGQQEKQLQLKIS